MTVVVVKGELTSGDIIRAREDYSGYIKVTADISKRIVAIGGEYHVDAEEILVAQFQSRSENIWGGAIILK